MRPDHEDILEDLIYKMFERRNHRYVGGQEKAWLTAELVQALRRESDVYRNELSTKTSGPLPFALGYFRLHDGQLRLTTDQVPANVSPRVLMRLVSEFVQPGARFWFGGPENEGEGWAINGKDCLERLTWEEATAPTT